VSVPQQLLTSLSAAAAQGTQPAGGAATDEVIIATTSAAVLTAALLVLGLGHCSGRVRVLGTLAEFAHRRSGMPGWAALPAAVATASLLTAVAGMYWDISLHIDVGRDPGPLANPPITSSSPGCSASSRPASSPSCCRPSARAPRPSALRRGGTRRWAACS